MDLRDEIQRMALEWPCYGWRRVRVELRRRGWTVNYKRVRRIMREDNLLCLRRRKFVVTTDSNHNLPVYPNLAGELVLTGINQLWVADITYIRLEVEFVYLAVVLDAYQHSDRGVQYAPGDYTDLLKDNKILISMSRKGNPVLTKVISGLLYGITATDTPTYIATVVLFAAVAFIYSNSHPSARRGNHRSGGSHPA